MKNIFFFVIVILSTFCISLAQANEKYALPNRGVYAEIKLHSGRIIQDEKQFLESFDEIFNDEYINKSLQTIEAVDQIAYNKIVYDNCPKEAIKVTLPEAKLIKIKNKEYHLKNMLLIQYQYQLDSEKFVNLYLGAEEIKPYNPTFFDKIWFEVYGIPSWAHRGRPLLLVFDLMIFCIFTRIIYKSVHKEKRLVKKKLINFIIKLILLCIFWYIIMHVVVIADSIRA